MRIQSVHVDTNEPSESHMLTEKPTKFRQFMSKKQLMAIVFCDLKLVLLVEFMGRGMLNTAGDY